MCSTSPSVERFRMWITCLEVMCRGQMAVRSPPCITQVSVVAPHHDVLLSCSIMVLFNANVCAQENAAARRKSYEVHLNSAKQNTITVDCFLPTCIL